MTTEDEYLRGWSFKTERRRERGIHARWFGVTWYRHPKLEDGPHVWTFLVRIGKKKPLV